MIPNRRSSKIHMEVRVAASGTHQAIALYLGTYELHVFGRNIWRPVVANPAQVIHYSRWSYHLTQSATKSHSWLYKFLVYETEVNPCSAAVNYDWWSCGTLFPMLGYHVKLVTVRQQHVQQDKIYCPGFSLHEWGLDHQIFPFHKWPLCQM